MAESGSREAWSHTSAMMALIANVNRDPKKSRRFTRADFDPWAQQKSVVKLSRKESFAFLKEVFAKGA